MNNNQQNLHFYLYAKSMPMVLIFAVVEIAMIAGIWLQPLNIYLWIGAVLTIMLSLNLSSLTLAIDDDSIYLIYGIGVFQKIIDIHTIETMEMVPNNFFQAIYNIASQTALRITERSGRRSTISIGDTRKILEFLRTKVRG